MLASVPLYVFPFCMLAAAISDIRAYIIPNLVSIILVFGFFICFALSGLDYHHLINHVATGLIMLIVGIALFAFNIFGAGDSKLLAAVALWLGWPDYGVALVFITFAGGVLATSVFAVRLFARWYPSVSLKVPALGRLAATEKIDLPYGVAIAIGATFVFPNSSLYEAIVGAV